MDIKDRTQMNAFQEYYKALVERNIPENRESAGRAADYLKHSTAIYKGQTIDTLYMAKAFPEEVKVYLAQELEKMYCILIKIMKEYLRATDYRQLFGFDKRLEQLILKLPPYENLLPICRLDFFLDEEDLTFKFCEFNADGCSAMNEDRELNQMLKHTWAYTEISKEYEIHSFELFDTWAETFLSIYQSIAPGKTFPNVAIVDFLEKGCSMEEFNHFKECFRQAGMNTCVSEIRSLKYDGEKLCTADGMKIDAIYRRAVTSDILENIEEVQDFIRAVEDGKVVLIGDFCTQIIHDKTLFYLLHHERTYAFLDASEIAFLKEHIPYTAELTGQTIGDTDILVNKDGWIIKPKDSYGAKGVFAGKYYDEKEWKGLVDKYCNCGYIMQEYIESFRSWNIDFGEASASFKKYSNLTGAYLYGGKLAGFYSRQSESGIICDETERDIASVWITL